MAIAAWGTVAIPKDHQDSTASLEGDAVLGGGLEARGLKVLS